MVLEQITHQSGKERLDKMPAPFHFQISIFHFK